MDRSVQLAESSMDNTFHCKTVDCRGWCEFQPGVNQFVCPVCFLKNCLQCQVRYRKSPELIIGAHLIFGQICVSCLPQYCTRSGTWLFGNWISKYGRVFQVQFCACSRIQIHQKLMCSNSHPAWCVDCHWSWSVECLRLLRFSRLVWPFISGTLSTTFPRENSGRYSRSFKSRVCIVFRERTSYVSRKSCHCFDSDHLNYSGYPVKANQ